MNPAAHNAENARAVRNTVMACPLCYTAAKLVFLRLADAADVDGFSGVDRSVVPLDTITAMSGGRQRTTVLRALQRLVDCGHVELLQLTTNANGRTRPRNHYRVVMP